MNIKRNDLLRGLTGSRISRIQKRFLTMRMIVLVLLCMSVPVSADAAKEDVETIRVGFFHFDGYHDISGQGARSGYGYEFLRLLSRYTNLNFEYVGYDKSWEEMQEMLKNGEIDMVTSMHYTETRSELYDFSTYIGLSRMILTVRNDNTTLTAENYTDFDGIRVGLLENSSRNKVFETYAKERGFRYVPVQFEDQEELTDALESGEVEAIVTSNLRKLGNERIVEEFDSEKFYAAVKKGNQELLSKINYGISQMDIYEGNWRNKLYYDNYDAPSMSEIIYSEKEKAFLNARQKSEQTLRIYFVLDSQPYCFIEDGEIMGIIPDIVRHVLDKTGLKYEFAAAEDPQDYKQIFEERKADIVPAMAGTDSYAESMGYLMTDGYMTNYICRLSGKNGDNGTGKIAVPAVAVYRQDLSADEKEVVLYPTARDAVEAVKNGEADAAYLEYLTCQWFVNNENQSDSLIYELVPEITYDMQMAVDQELPHELCSILNKNLIRLTRAELQSVIQKYVDNPVAELSLGEYIRANWEEFLLYAGIGVTVVLAITAIVLKYVKKIIRLNGELRQALDAYKQADYDRRTDFLTGLHNRQDMFEMLQEVLSGRQQVITAMFMMDIDDFKRLNDRYGHVYGDECLKRIGAALNAYGTENNMIFYRYGGEEILGISFSENKQADQIAEELVQLVRDQRILRDDTPFGMVTASLGYTTNNRRYEKMIDLADAAMYRAKENGKNQAACSE